MSASISSKNLLFAFSLLVLVMLLVMGLKLWEFPVTCFSPPVRQELEPSIGLPTVEPTDCYNPVKWQKSDTNGTDLSEHPDMEVRGKWQRKVISDFCHRHGFDNQIGTLPVDKSVDKSSRKSVHQLFNRHVLFNLDNMALFCFIPKVGCTNMKSSIFVAGGYLSSSLLNATYNSDRNTLEPQLERAINMGTFKSSSLTDEKRRTMMYQFDKYTMIRHPLERHVSAYRSKFRKPLLWHPPPQLVYFEGLKRNALRKCEPQLFANWSKVEQADVIMNFTCYIVWLTKYDAPDGDDHFMTLMDNCQPCRMHYHFYGNFKNYASDGMQILSKFTNDLSSFFKESYYDKGKQTSDMLPDYYSQLTPSLKKTLYEHIKLDLEFYHTLYPSGIQLTKDLLGLDVVN